MAHEGAMRIQVIAETLEGACPTDVRHATALLIEDGNRTYVAAVLERTRPDGLTGTSVTEDEILIRPCPDDKVPRDPMGWPDFVDLWNALPEPVPQERERLLSAYADAARRHATPPDAPTNSNRPCDESAPVPC